MSDGSRPPDKELHSWKEIAAYLGVTVRTVQRWETSGLPVHRIGSGKKARVFAYPDELREWFQAGGGRDLQGEDDEPPESDDVDIPSVPVEEQPALEPVAAPVPRPSAQRFPIQRTITVALVLAVVAIILGFSGILKATRVPHRWQLDGAKLVILDVNGEPCWSVWLPDAPVWQEAGSDEVVIADIDADGRTEVLVNYSPPNVSAVGGSVICFEHSGKQRWERKYGSPKKFGVRLFEHTYKGKHLKPVKVGGRRLILAVANHYLWYPSQAALLDPKDGSVVAEYWHPGAIYHCVLEDFDGDGEQEVLLGTINNPGLGLGHAGLALLELPFPKAPPEQPGERFPAATGGGERAYVLFPLPDTSRAVGQLPIMSAMQVDEHRRIRVHLPEPQGAIIYYLDFNLKVLEFRPSDDYPAVHERLYRQHLLDHPLSSEELAELGRVAHFAAAPDGNSDNVNRLWKY